MISILYDGTSSFIPFRRLTSNEIEHCRRLRLTFRDDWNPYHLQCRWAAMSLSSILNTPSTYTDPIWSELISSSLKERAKSYQILCVRHSGTKNFSREITFSTLKRINLRVSNSLTSERLSTIWQIDLKTTKSTIQATTHKCIRFTGILATMFKAN